MGREGSWLDGIRFCFLFFGRRSPPGQSGLAGRRYSASVVVVYRLGGQQHRRFEGIPPGVGSRRGGNPRVGGRGAVHGTVGFWDVPVWMVGGCWSRFGALGWPQRGSRSEGGGGAGPSLPVGVARMVGYWWWSVPACVLRVGAPSGLRTAAGCRVTARTQKSAIPGCDNFLRVFCVKVQSFKKR